MPAPSFDDTITALNLEAHRDAWRAYWPALDNLPNPHDSWLFQPGRLDELCAWLGLAPEPAAVLKEGLAAALASPHVRLLLAQAIRTFSMAHVQPPPLPRPPAELGAWAPVFAGLVVLGCVPVTRRRHEARGIPASVTRETFNDVTRWMRTYHEANGRWGFTQSDWLFNHVSTRLVELGRLQFGMHTCTLPYHVFAGKGSENGKVIALATDGQRIRPDGQFLCADRNIDRDGPHAVTRFDLREHAVTGHPVSNACVISQTTVTLPLDRWTRIIEPGTPMLDVHIPGYAPLDDVAVGESFRRAMEFFPRYFPEHRFAGFTCVSWLMDPQLADHLPAESNMVKFLRRFRILPAPGCSDFQHFERVFGGPVKDFASAPRDTTLKKALLEHVEAGGRWRYAAGYILRNDLPV
ncbi:MAG: acyltransferase domain-containing protein [Planctomycetes bacterium]|nr:acyltransferase domain-containing protein [Planctomycetota bacterium]